jgi:hypothetical protein
MINRPKTIVILILFILGIAILTAGCGRNQPVVPTTAPTAVPSAVPTAQNLPEITTVELDRSELPRYESIEMKLAVKAEYTNPYDARQVRLDAVFTGPDGKEMTVPGFWDGEEAWRVRFTPSLEGEWNYRLVVKDVNGESQSVGGKFNVTASDLHGWIQVGDWVNPDYSARYLVYQDGTPFYGVGHCDALNILIDGFNVERGVGLFENMQAAGENYVVWWPLYSNSPINNNYDDYSVSNMKTIDMVVKDAQKKGIFLIFTIWDHPDLRAKGHAWGDGKWEGNNGFRKLGDIDSFFTSDEAWVWQENFYRYTIARWGYSPAIGMWQTVTEINGTNAYDQANPWHEKVNAYFVQNDPYRHPTTASMSGDTNWPEGFKVMDVPQTHVYALEKDVVKAAQTMAYWTTTMWDEAEKPNWVGEFGVQGNSYYPEMFHNSIWAALASGAAMTPAEWNSGGAWARMTPEMNADISRLGQFVVDIPLAKLDPVALTLAPNDAQVRGWGVAGNDGGLFWVQDFSMEGKTIEEVRAATINHTGVTLDIQGLVPGTYTIYPYDTWQGTYLDTFEVSCTEREVCTVNLPEFNTDMAFKLERK